MDEQGQERVDELTLEAPSGAGARSPRRRALWAVLAFVGLVAGGLVVSSAHDDDGVRSLPVDLAAAARSSGGGEAAADAMLAWIVYAPGDDLPSLGGEATAYRLSGDVDEAQVRELADALGLDGAVESDGASSWWLDAGGAGRLDVGAGSGASWSFFAGARDCVTGSGSISSCCDPGEACETFSSTGVAVGGGSAGCDGAPDCTAPTTSTAVDPCRAPNVDCVAEPSPPDTGSSCAGDDCLACAEGAPCPDVEPSPDLPDEQDARAAALAVVAAAGNDVDGARVDAHPGFDSWAIVVEPEVDGLPSGLPSYVEVGPDLRVLSGSGVMGPAEPVGEFPLLDTRAAIERANAQSGSPDGIEPAIGDSGSVAGTTGGSDTTMTDDIDATVTTAAGEGGTTGCGGDGCVEETTTSIPCKVQADGSEICELEECWEGTVDTGGDPAVDVRPCEVPACPQPLPPEGTGAPETVDCTPPLPTPEPAGPAEVVLVDAEHALVLLPANDGSGDAYLVPAYRFTTADGGTVDLPAIAEEALGGPSTTETSVPDTVVPPPVPDPVPEPQPCEVLEEQDPGTETTHTVQTCPGGEDDLLEIGGEGYYVDIDVECGGGSFVLGGRVWTTDDEEVAGWADPGERHEGGMFTLDAEDHGTFVGDAQGTLTAEFRTLQPNEDLFCTPEPR